MVDNEKAYYNMTTSLDFKKVKKRRRRASELTKESSIDKENLFDF